MKKIVALLTLILFSYVAYGDDVNISARVDKALASTGDYIVFTVTIEHIDQIKMDFPDIGSSIEGFRIVEFGENPTKTDEGRTTLERWYKLQADISGTYILPAIGLTYADTQGNEKTIKSSEIFVEIESPVDKEKQDGKEADDIKDIKDLILIPSYFIWYIIIGALLAIGLFFLVWYLANRKKDKKERVVYIPPHIEALDRLKDLRKASYIQKKEYKKFSFDLSEIIRNYFERVYNFPATDRTFQEIKRDINGVKSLNDKLKKKFLEVLDKTDVVKFTDTSFPDEEFVGFLELTEDFVNDTKPEEDPKSEEDSVI